MTRFYFLLLLLLGVLTLKAQTCVHKNLSDSFNITSVLKRYPMPGQTMDSCVVTVILTDKAGKIIQKIKLKNMFLFSDAFIKNNNARSYSTGYNRKADVMDNDFGDIVVADLNFDGKEDMAIKHDSGGNGGPTYSFYTQIDSSKFKSDPFLTDSMGFFPDTIDKQAKTLTTLVHANAYERCKKVFGQDVLTGKWKLLKKSFVKY